MTTILIVRHGETAYNKQGIYQGRLDVSLNEMGQQQAENLSEWLSGRYRLHHVYCSPLLRAQATAQAIVARQECSITLEPELQEIDVGLWEGLTGNQAKEAHPEAWQRLQEDNLYARRPQGESYWDLYQRVNNCMDRLASRHPDETICLVSHGGCVRVMLAHAMGVPATTFSFISGMQVDNTGVSVLHYDDSGRWLVRSINNTCHLSPVTK